MTKPKAKRAVPKDATTQFIDTIKEANAPVPPTLQLEAQGQTKAGRNTSAGSLEEFNAIISMIKRQLAHKGISSMDDV
jgi:hypothetical protein